MIIVAYRRRMSLAVFGPVVYLGFWYYLDCDESTAFHFSVVPLIGSPSTAYGRA